MVHRNSATLLINTNDVERKILLENSADIVESRDLKKTKKLSQFEDNLELSKLPTGKLNKKSTTSVVSGNASNALTSRSRLVQQKKITKITVSKKSNNYNSNGSGGGGGSVNSKYNSKNNKNSDNNNSNDNTKNCNIDNNGSNSNPRVLGDTVDNEKKIALEDSSSENSLSPSVSVRSGLRSSNFEKNRTDDASLMAIPKCRGRKMKKKRKEVTMLDAFDSSPSIAISKSDTLSDLHPPNLICSLPLERLSGILKSVVSSTIASDVGTVLRPVAADNGLDTEVRTTINNSKSIGAVTNVNSSTVENAETTVGLESNVTSSFSNLTAAKSTTATIIEAKSGEKLDKVLAVNEILKAAESQEDENGFKLFGKDIGSIEKTSDCSLNQDHSSQTTKSLCLYCDKKFSSQKLRIKHTERVHAVAEGRRHSSRNLTSCSVAAAVTNAAVVASTSVTTTPSAAIAAASITTATTTTTIAVTAMASVAPSSIANSDTTISTNMSYPGCVYCCSSTNSSSSNNSTNNSTCCNNTSVSIVNSSSNNSNGSISNNSSNSNNSSTSISTSTSTSTNSSSISSSNSSKITIAGLVSDDLKALFHHLINSHSDKYFACKLCAIRFQNSDLMEKHFKIKHEAISNKLSLNKTSSSIVEGKEHRNRNPSIDDESHRISGACLSETNLNNKESAPIEVDQPLHVLIDSSCSDRSSPNPIAKDQGNGSNLDASTGTTYNQNSPASDNLAKTRRQMKQALENKTNILRSCQNLLRNDAAMLSRLGVAQNRLPRNRKGIRNRRLVNLELESSTNFIKTRSKVGRVITSNVPDILETVPVRTILNSKVEAACTFDDDFYETVNLNVKKNLSCYLDGKLDSGTTSPGPLSPTTTVPTIPSTVVRSPLYADGEIHEATTLEAITTFPTLLTAEQYGNDLAAPTKIKKPITKNSWKWKWDCVKKYKYVNEGGKIVKKIKQPVVGLRDLSKLDMWTQLTMRTRHENARREANALAGTTEVLEDREAAREEKRKQIAQLNTILDTRRLPQIVLEQNEQTIIKMEPVEEAAIDDLVAAETENANCSSFDGNSTEDFSKSELLQALSLKPNRTTTLSHEEDVILSGEWARPRCYICYGCGAKFDKLKTIEEHKTFRHPHVHSTHYEIVGRELIEGELYKHFYIPTKALHRNRQYRQMLTQQHNSSFKTEDIEQTTAGEESMDSMTSLSASIVTGTTKSDFETESKSGRATTSSLATTLEMDEESSAQFQSNCTKCQRECNGLMEMYRHMLDCSGDYTWMMAKKRKYRYYGGSRKRRNTRQNIAFQHRKSIKCTPTKSHTKSDDESSTPNPCKTKDLPPTPRPPRPSDAESIRRMLENLPAKRACRQIIPNITKPRIRKFTPTLGLKKTILVNGNCGKKGKTSVMNIASTTVTAITKNMRRKHRILTRQFLKNSGNETGNQLLERKMRSRLNVVHRTHELLKRSLRSKSSPNQNLSSKVTNKTCRIVKRFAQKLQQRNTNETFKVTRKRLTENSPNGNRGNSSSSSSSSSSCNRSTSGSCRGDPVESKKSKESTEISPSKRKSTDSECKKASSQKKTAFRKSARTNSSNSNASTNRSSSVNSNTNFSCASSSSSNAEERTSSISISTPSQTPTATPTPRSTPTPIPIETTSSTPTSNLLIVPSPLPSLSPLLRLEQGTPLVVADKKIDKSTETESEICDDPPDTVKRAKPNAKTQSLTPRKPSVKKKNNRKNAQNKSEEKPNSPKKSSNSDKNSKIEKTSNEELANDASQSNTKNELQTSSSTDALPPNDNPTVDSVPSEIESEKAVEIADAISTIPTTGLEKTDISANDKTAMPSAAVVMAADDLYPKDGQFVGNQNNKKRGKKLTDCIAMLTDKWQEKLGKPVFNTCANLDSLLLTAASTASPTANAESQNKSPTPAPVEVPTSESNCRNQCDSTTYPKENEKNQKRKTMTRKIIQKERITNDSATPNSVITTRSSLAVSEMCPVSAENSQIDPKTEAPYNEPIIEKDEPTSSDQKQNDSKKVNLPDSPKVESVLSVETPARKMLTRNSHAKNRSNANNTTDKHGTSARTTVVALSSKRTPSPKKESNNKSPNTRKQSLSNSENSTSTKQEESTKVTEFTKSIETICKELRKQKDLKDDEKLAPTTVCTPSHNSDLFDVTIQKKQTISMQHNIPQTIQKPPSEKLDCPVHFDLRTSIIQPNSEMGLNLSLPSTRSQLQNDLSKRGISLTLTSVPSVSGTHSNTGRSYLQDIRGAHIFENATIESKKINETASRAVSSEIGANEIKTAKFQPMPIQVPTNIFKNPEAFWRPNTQIAHQNDAIQIYSNMKDDQKASLLSLGVIPWDYVSASRNFRTCTDIDAKSDRSHLAKNLPLETLPPALRFESPHVETFRTSGHEQYDPIQNRRSEMEKTISKEMSQHRPTEQTDGRQFVLETPWDCTIFSINKSGNEPTPMRGEFKSPILDAHVAAGQAKSLLGEQISHDKMADLSIAFYQSRMKSMTAERNDKLQLDNHVTHNVPQLDVDFDYKMAERSNKMIQSNPFSPDTITSIPCTNVTSTKSSPTSTNKSKATKGRGKRKDTTTTENKSTNVGNYLCSHSIDKILEDKPPAKATTVQMEVPTNAKMTTTSGERTIDFTSVDPEIIEAHSKSDVPKCIPPDEYPCEKVIWKKKIAHNLLRKETNKAKELPSIASIPISHSMSDAVKRQLTVPLHANKDDNSSFQPCFMYEAKDFHDVHDNTCEALDFSKWGRMTRSKQLQQQQQQQQQEQQQQQQQQEQQQQQQLQQQQPQQPQYQCQEQNQQQQQKQQKQQQQREQQQLQLQLYMQQDKQQEQRQDHESQHNQSQAKQPLLLQHKQEQIFQQALIPFEKKQLELHAEKAFAVPQTQPQIQDRKESQSEQEIKLPEKVPLSVEKESQTIEKQSHELEILSSISENHQQKQVNLKEKQSQPKENGLEFEKTQLLQSEKNSYQQIEHGSEKSIEELEIHTKDKDQPTTNKQESDLDTRAHESDLDKLCHESEDQKQEIVEHKQTTDNKQDKIDESQQEDGKIELETVKNDTQTVSVENNSSSIAESQQQIECNQKIDIEKTSPPSRSEKLQQLRTSTRQSRKQQYEQEKSKLIKSQRNQVTRPAIKQAQQSSTNKFDKNTYNHKTIVKDAKNIKEIVTKSSEVDDIVASFLSDDESIEINVPANPSVGPTRLSEAEILFLENDVEPSTDHSKYMVEPKIYDKYKPGTSQDSEAAWLQEEDFHTILNDVPSCSTSASDTCENESLKWEPTITGKDSNTTWDKSLPAELISNKLTADSSDHTNDSENLKAGDAKTSPKKCVKVYVRKKRGQKVDNSASAPSAESNKDEGGRNSMQVEQEMLDSKTHSLKDVQQINDELTNIADVIPEKNNEGANIDADQTALLETLTEKYDQLEKTPHDSPMNKGHEENLSKDEQVLLVEVKNKPSEKFENEQMLPTDETDTTKPTASICETVSKESILSNKTNASNVAINMNETSSPNETITTVEKSANDAESNNPPDTKDHEPENNTPSKTTGQDATNTKKQRRRRKNELAAIVADQLMESFKEVDKSRIDNLKMLENLAYEKSEDLYITGMRLAPTTKRKIVENKDNEILSALEKSSTKSKIKPKRRSKSQPNSKSDKKITSTKPGFNKSIETEAIVSKENRHARGTIGNKRKCGITSSQSHDKLFRNTQLEDEPFRNNFGNFNQKENLKICSNVKITGTDSFAAFKTSTFDTFRSLSESIPVNFQKETERKFVPGPAETSNSVDSHMHDDLKNTTENNEKLKPTTNRKLKKRFNRKKDKKVENVNINELRSGLESFSFEKETAAKEASQLRKKKTNKDVLAVNSKLSLVTNEKSTKQVDMTIGKIDISGVIEPGIVPKAVDEFPEQTESIKVKPLLRPSILSVITPETPTGSNNTSDSHELDSNKQVFSRDPRLNKSKIVSRSPSKEPLSTSIPASIESEDVATKCILLLEEVGHPQKRTISESKKLQDSKSIVTSTAATTSSEQKSATPSRSLMTRSSSILAQVSTAKSITALTPKPITIETSSSSAIAPRILQSEIDSCSDKNLDDQSSDDQNEDNDKPLVHLNKSQAKPLSCQEASSNAQSTTKSIVMPADEEDSDYEDTCLAELAKSVNEKIMSSEDEEFSHKYDGFETTNECLPFSRKLGQYELNSERDLVHSGDEQSNGDFLHDDDNTNTELIDMDLEDDVSVYTSFSQDISGLNGKNSRFGVRRRRRKSVLLTPRKSRKTPTDSSGETTSFDCSICNKSFRKAAALSKHKMTITHISKLSEHEYLNKSFEECNSEQLQKRDKQVDTSDISIEPTKPAGKNRKSDIVDSLKEDLVEEAAIKSHTTDNDVSPAIAEEEVSFTSDKIAKSQSTPSNVTPHPTIEPILPSDQMDPAYDRYNTSSRIALSQEERLFYECCNMLKGSETPMIDRTYPVTQNTYASYDVPNKPVTPRSVERFSYLGSEASGNFQHSTGYTVKSPMSQPRTSPRHAYPKIDINQFSDISSDSNPAFPRLQPHPALQSNLIITGNIEPPYGKVQAYDHQPMSQRNLEISPVMDNVIPPPIINVSTKTSTTISVNVNVNVNVTTVSNRCLQKPEVMAVADNNCCPTTQIVVTAENDAQLLTARTFFQDDRTKEASLLKESNTVRLNYSTELSSERNVQFTEQTQSFTSPIHSTSSQGSTNCRMRTKAAMKGYDNFKVSISTAGLDMQQALERSPHSSCKLTALAEIALGNEAVPNNTSRFPVFQQIRDDNGEKTKVKSEINEQFAKKYQELIMNNIKPTSLLKTSKKKDGENPCQKVVTKGRKTKMKDTSVGITCESPKVLEKAKDVYEFDESNELQRESKTLPKLSGGSKSSDDVVIPERPFKDIGLEEQQSIKFQKPGEPHLQNEESLLSTTSYSDRDDFNYGSMSENDERCNENEEQSDSDSNCSSARTAKTIENKCLIVGRIFKNATKNRIEDKKLPEKISPEAIKKKLPTQELDKLFDSLRKDRPKILEAHEMDGQYSAISDAIQNQTDQLNIIEREKPTQTNGNESASVENGNDKSEMGKQLIQSNEEQPIEDTKKAQQIEISKIQSTIADEDKTIEMQVESAKKQGLKKPRGIYKLQSELGMSAEDVAELIGEGKRKSQRRCAANRQRKVVETWSSDEYEDFLSTKDIIALIEEKEKKTKRKRKPTATNNKLTDNNKTNTIEEKSTDIIPEKDNSCTAVTIEPDTDHVKPLDVRISNKNKLTIKEKQQAPSIVKNRNINLVRKKVIQTTDIVAEKSTPDTTENTTENSTNKNKTRHQVAKVPKIDKRKIHNKKPTATDVRKEASNSMIEIIERNSTKKPTLSVKPRLKTYSPDSESDFESEWRRGSQYRRRAKPKKRRKTISYREDDNDKSLVDDHDIISESSISLKMKPSIPDDVLSMGPKKPIKVANQIAFHQTIPGNTDLTRIQSQAQSRRKRVASEMLYYWSSSSDEEFGRIETRDDDDDDPSQNGEHYQQHGWIVGDSHKKLVTLLAIAKGKKVEDCGVKQTITKKKS